MRLNLGGWGGRPTGGVGGLGWGAYMPTTHARGLQPSAGPKEEGMGMKALHERAQWGVTRAVRA